MLSTPLHFKTKDSKFEEIRVLGRGSFGKAVLVRDSNYQLFVVKEINIASLSSIDQASAYNEVRILQSLRHPNIITSYTSFVRDGKLNIVMEYADGGDLATLVSVARTRSAKRKCGPRYLPGSYRFDEDLVWYWFAQIVQAIEHIHSFNILHRDIKCANVFLTKATNIVKLGDFGISKQLESSKELAKTTAGTPINFSPEICQGKNYGKKSDCWGLGCVLYKLISLEPAFTGRNLAVVIKQILSGAFAPIKPNPSVRYSSEIHQLISDLLNVDSTKRPSAKEMLKNEMISYQSKRFFSFLSTVKHSKKITKFNPNPNPNVKHSKKITKLQVDMKSQNVTLLPISERMKTQNFIQEQKGIHKNSKPNKQRSNYTKDNVHRNPNPNLRSVLHCDFIYNRKQVGKNSRNRKSIEKNSRNRKSVENNSQNQREKKQFENEKRRIAIAQLIRQKYNKIDKKIECKSEVLFCKKLKNIAENITNRKKRDNYNDDKVIKSKMNDGNAVTIYAPKPRIDVKHLQEARSKCMRPNNFDVPIEIYVQTTTGAKMSLWTPSDIE